jgi:NitT/TauT family transport system substrate-binding protein
MNRSFRIAAVFLGLAGGLIAPSAGLAQDLMPLRIGLSVPDPVHTLLYIAEARGFMREAGLATEIVQFQGGGAAAQALTAGAVDVNQAAIFEVIESYSRGRDLTAVWSVSNFPAYIWYGQSKYKSIADLKGKGRIGISGVASMTYAVIRWGVANAGLNPDSDVSYMTIGGPLERVAALRAGQVDAIPATPPGSFLLQQEGYVPLLDLRDVMPEFQFEVLYMRRGKISENARAVKALIRAELRAKAWALNNRDEAAEILRKSLGGRDEDRAIYRQTLDAVLPYFPEDGHYAEKSIGLFLDFYRSQGKIKEVPPLSAFVDTRFIAEIRQGN